MSKTCYCRSDHTKALCEHYINKGGFNCINILFKVNNRFPTLQTWASDFERPFSNGKIKET